MSDFDVVDDDMRNRALSEADIEALVTGTTVVGGPTPLIDLLASLRQRAAATPSVPVSGALSEFIVGQAPVLTPGATSPTHRRPAVAVRRPTSLLARASALLGLVPAYVLIGATAAAAAVGGAQLLGIVDVPFLPDRGHHVETPALTPPEPGTVVPPAVAEPATAAPSSRAEAGDNSTAASALPESPTGQRAEPAEPALPGPADPNATTVGCAPATTHPAGPPTSQVATPTTPPAIACEPTTPASTTPAATTPVTTTPGTRPTGPVPPPNSSQPTTPTTVSQAGQPAAGPPSTSATNLGSGRTPSP